jgi:IS1 family transposase
MNILSRDKQVEVLAALCEGVGIRATARLTGVNRKTVAHLALQIGEACAELHDRTMVGLRVGRIEMDELWSFVGKKQRRVTRDDDPEKGDQYTFVALASTTRAIITYRTGKRDTATTQEFIADLRERVLGAPEISTDGFKPYGPAIRTEFRNSPHGIINKTYSVTHLAVKEASRRYSPAAVIAVEREVGQGMPVEISTSYAERSNLSIRMGCRRLTRLTNAFSKRLEQHRAAISLFVAHYNPCRVHESLSPNMRQQVTPAMALGIADHVWSIGELLDATLTILPTRPTTSPLARRRRFRVIEGGRCGA